MERQAANSDRYAQNVAAFRVNVAKLRQSQALCVNAEGGAYAPATAAGRNNQWTLAVPTPQSGARENQPEVTAVAGNRGRLQICFSILKLVENADINKATVISSAKAAVAPDCYQVPFS